MYVIVGKNVTYYLSYLHPTYTLYGYVIFLLADLFTAFLPIVTYTLHIFCKVRPCELCVEFLKIIVITLAMTLDQDVYVVLFWTLSNNLQPI